MSYQDHVVLDYTGYEDLTDTLCVDYEIYTGWLKSHFTPQALTQMSKTVELSGTKYHNFCLIVGNKQRFNNRLSYNEVPFLTYKNVL